MDTDLATRLVEAAELLPAILFAGAVAISAGLAALTFARSRK